MRAVSQVASASAAGTVSFWAAVRLGVRSMGRRPALAALFISATLVQGALQGALVWALREVLEAFSGHGEITTKALLAGALTIFGIWILRSLSLAVAEVVSVRLSHSVETESMLEVVTKLLSLSVRFFDRNSRGDVVMAAYHDLKGVRAVTIEVGRVVLYVSQLAGLGVAAWLMSPKLAIVGLVTVPLGALPAYWLGREITDAARGERQAVSTLHDSFLQVALGFRAVKVNRGQSRVLDHARRVGHELHGHLVRQAKSRGLARFLLESVSGLGLILVLTIGGRDVASGAMEWQALLGLLFAIMAVYGPVVGLLQLYNTIRTVIPSLDRVEAILCEPPEIADRPSARALHETPQTIELRNVSFAYEGRLVLDSVSATFHRGETIGIVGPSGAGKSTLLSMLLRFYDPTDGAVLFDSVDLRDVRHADLMTMSALVVQEPFLFTDTVAANIRLGRPEASTEDVIAAASAANLHEEVLGMEQGYDTVVGSGKAARGVSGGQKQRICIASALLKNAPLLFLDEATSSLDSVAEQKVQGAIERLMRGRTTFVIAHRLSTLRHADRILVLEQGRLVGLGTHAQLIDRCETYRRLWITQRLAQLAASGAPATAVTSEGAEVPTGFLGDAA